MGENETKVEEKKETTLNENEICKNASKKKKKKEETETASLLEIIAHQFNEKAMNKETKLTKSK